MDFVNKVVKIEEVSRVGQSPERDDLLTSPTSKPPSVKSSIIDAVYPMPENWPRIPQLDGRRSCEFTKSTLPCVNKAVSHLELLQNSIHQWFQHAEEEIKSQKSSRPQSEVSIQVPVPPKKQLRFFDEREATPSKKSESASTVSRPTSLTPELHQLSIQGVGARLDESPYAEDTVDDVSLPYLGGEDVVEEVIVLLARLEKDRQETEAEWKKEQERVTILTDKIDKLCLKRLKELPAIVQREHEACILDLNELQWHVSYCSRSETRIKDRKEIAEVLNARLKEDIDFVKRHIPLVQEKLLLELEAMDKIKQAQQETNNELDMTKQRQTKTEIKNLEANNKAETERGHIKQELDTVKDHLSQINDELDAAKMTYSAYTQQIDDIKQKLKDNTQELLILEVKRENACDSAEHHTNKVKEYHEDIDKSGVEFNRLQNENIFLEKELKTTKNRIDHDTSKLHATIKQLEGKIRALHLRNQEAKMEIQDAEDKIEKCKKQKVADEKNMVRITKEISRTEGIMLTTLEEYTQILSTNLMVKDLLAAEEDKIFQSEETLKNAIETLTRQVKDEIHNRTVLQSRINSDSTEIEKTRVESGKKQDKAVKVADDVDTAVNTVLNKVQKLRSSKVENSKMKVTLADNISETQKQHTESRDRFLEKLTQIEPKHAELKENLAEVNKQIDHINWRKDMMTKNIEDMDSSEGFMKRVVNSTEKAIKHHGEDLIEFNIQLDTTKKIEADLSKAFTEIQDRYHLVETRHNKLMSERQKTLHKTLNEKDRELSNNRSLAAKYRQLQNEYIITKETLLNNYERRVKLENSLTDLKRLQSLQKKMHGALTEMYKLSGKYNNSELARMEIEASRNGARVHELQDEMDQALRSITTFLQTQMDGSVAKQMAWEVLNTKDTGRPPSTTPGSLISSHASKSTSVLAN